MQTNSNDDPTIQASTDRLQDFLRAELAAVDTYEMALRHVSHVGLSHALREILASHARRAEQIRVRVVRFGATPADGTGAWGAFAKTLQAGADLLGDHMAVSALEQGEDHTLALYRDAIGKVDFNTQKFIEAELMPAERHTHDLCRTLKTYTKAPS